MTYGLELEYGDWLITTKLPCGAVWNKMDNTCVNSNGIANDPLGRLYIRGGEINTRWTCNIAEQVNK